jgi:phosphatidylglycerol---prolipoprotein diacylglyceryl transferase
MAFHGAVLGVFIVSLIYIKIKKINIRELADLVFPVIPLGYTFGRIANFINSELWGRITASPIGVLFPDADKVPLNLPEVQNVINQLGWKINEITNTVINSSGIAINNVLGNVLDTNIPGINLPRYPSQLFEAFFEGIILFLIIWFPARKYKPFKGFLAPVYLCGYAIARISLENIRQPDSQFADAASGKFIGYIIGNLTMGQILSWIMLFFGIGLGVYFYLLEKKENKVK